MTFDKVALSDLILKIRNCGELVGNSDAEDELVTIEDELRKNEPNRKFIKKSLLFLKDVAVNIGADMAVQFITSAMGMC